MRRQPVTFVFFVFFVVKQPGLLDRRQPQAVNHIDHIDHKERDAFNNPAICVRR